MHSLLRLGIFASAILTLSACVAEPQQPLNNPGNAGQPGSQTPLSDGSNVNTLPPIGVDGLIPPNAPELSIAASPGKLQFSWVEKSTSNLPVTHIALYKFNSQTQVEKLISDTIEAGTNQFAYTVPVNQLSWDSDQFRVQLCTAANCVSSLRVPIDGLLLSAVHPLTPENQSDGLGFGDHVAMNHDGGVAVVTALAAVSQNLPPLIYVFERFGQTWLDTTTLSPTGISAFPQTWITDSAQFKLSPNGDRILFGIQAINAANATATRNYNNNQFQILDRDSTGWSKRTNLSIPAGLVRLPALTSNASIDRVIGLSMNQNEILIHEFALANNAWQNPTTSQAPVISPSIDMRLVANSQGTELVLAGWENLDTTEIVPVAWRLSKTSQNAWTANDSVRLPPSKGSNAKIRIATDASLDNMAIGWLGNFSSDLAFYNRNNQNWTHQFSLPTAFKLNRSVPLPQSVAISADNSVVLIGTTNRPAITLSFTARDSSSRYQLKALQQHAPAVLNLTLKHYRNKSL